MADESNRERRALEIFEELLAVNPAEHGALLDKACEGDNVLRERVEELLRASEADDADFAQASTVDVEEGGFAERLVRDLAGDSPKPPPESARRKSDTPMPTRIGPFRVLEWVGGGGMGEVYLAERREPFRQKVAVKVILPGIASKEILARFESERQALALMDHPNIAKVFDAGESETGEPYFVMEYVPGVPLTEYCDRYRLGVAERLGIFRDVCRAVHHAHQKGIVHRDLKPSNILVMNQDGKPFPKVIDFGVAKSTTQPLTEKTFHTDLGRIVGTLEYMSPEQAEITNLRIDHRTDVYSLGVILYELLVGVVPFESETLRQAGFDEMRRIIREEDPAKPSTKLTTRSQSLSDSANKRRTEIGLLVRQLRGDLDNITLRALAKDSNRRYESAEQFAEDVRRYLDNEPVVAKAPSLLYRAKKFTRRNKPAVAAASLVATILLGTLVWTWLAARGRYEDSYRAALQGLEEGTLAEATAAVDAFLLEYADAEEAPQLGERLEKKTFESRRAEAQTSLETAKRESDTHEEARGARDRARAEWVRLRRETYSYLPFWKRREELSRRREFDAQRVRADRAYNDGYLAASRAFEIAPPESPERAAASSLLVELVTRRHGEADRTGTVLISRESVGARLNQIDNSLVDRLPKGNMALTLRSQPAGAEIYCYRFLERDEAKVPVPFDPARGRENPADGILRGPRLVVQGLTGTRPAREGAAYFAPGDVLRSISGKPVRGRLELADVLSDFEAEEEGNVIVERAGTNVSFSWVPFPRSFYDEYEESLEPGETPILKPGDVVDIQRQLGVRFESYDLALHADSRVTGEIDLPRGDYLFVLRLPGHVDARLPLSIPRDGGNHTVRMMPTSRVPEGFVYVPAGTSYIGGDTAAYESLPEAEVNVEGFFISQYEVSISEYLEFINDDAVKPGIDPATGRAVATVDWEDPKLLELVPEKVLVPREQRKLRLIPYIRSRLWFGIDDETSRWVAGTDTSGPVFGLTILAMLEYAKWRTEKSGGRWRFRLAKDPEWERAARGSDGRIFVWGDYALPNRAWNLKGHYESVNVTRPYSRGWFTFDESPFGVRDLAGGVGEPVLERAAVDLQMCVVRGGYVDVTDPRDLRIATRNRRFVYQGASWIGIRLVADLDPPPLSED